MKPYPICKTIFQVEINKVANILKENWLLYVESERSVSFLYKNTLSFSWEAQENFPETPIMPKWNFGGTADIISKITQMRIFQPLYWNMCTSLSHYIACLDTFLSNKMLDLEIVELSKKEELILELFNSSKTFATFDQGLMLPEFGVNTSPNKTTGIGYSNNSSSKQTIADNYTEKTIMVLDKLWKYKDKIKNYTNSVKKIVQKITQEISAIDYDFYQESTLPKWIKLYDLTVKNNTNFKQVKMVEKFNTHYFSKNEKKILNSKLIKRIYSEIKSLNNSLPEKMIYLTWSENKMNLLKALFLPAEDTPYAGGFFEFDIFIPMEYPHVPPKVQFITTGGGIIRFNPNLYANGKVCLSLLGTWSGEPWIQIKSTLLQVLVSILGMIFVSKPYFNEPGYQSQEGTSCGEKKNKAYNKKIIDFTNKFATKVPAEFSWIKKN